MLKIYLIIVNAVALLLMLSDKSFARRKMWRIPEAALIGIAVIGGSVGALVGMYLFRHKTRHLKFRYGLPLLIILQAALLLWLPECPSFLNASAAFAAWGAAVNLIGTAATYARWI